MVIYFICGLFAGLLIGSWAAYYEINRMLDAPEKPDTVLPETKQPESADPKAVEAEQKADEQRRKQLEGLFNVLNYDGKPPKKDGDEQ
jgi:hypothetical protein